MQVTLRYAQEHFPDIVSAADRGEEVEIVRPDKPAMKLVVSTEMVSTGPKVPRALGGLAGMIRVPEMEEWKALSPLADDADPPPIKRIGRKHLFGAGEGMGTLPSDEEWSAMKKEFADEILNKPIFPSNPA